MALAAAAVVAVAWASSPWSASYHGVWAHRLLLSPIAPGVVTTRAWVDDGLLTVFFVVVGIEIGRERASGTLRSLRRAMVPVVAALGGMTGAAVTYAVVVHGGPGARAWGVPMATDIALVAGAAALLGDRVPARLRIFLITLAVADDVASVSVLAVVSGHRPAPAALGGAAAALVLLVVGHRRQWSAGSVLAVGIGLWVALAHAGIEPALAGVPAGLALSGGVTQSVRARRRTRRWSATSGPAVGAAEPGTVVTGSGSGPVGSGAGPADPGPAAPVGAPAARVLRIAHPLSAGLVLPVFALANVGVDLRGPLVAGPGAAAVLIGVLAARMVGKGVGVSLAAAVAERVGRPVHAALDLPHLVGGGALCGAGFTVPLLFAAVTLAGRPDLLRAARLGLLGGSAGAALLGAAVLLVADRARRHGAAPGAASGRPATAPDGS
jgi:NhaA family Na+:H+ antiporter